MWRSPPERARPRLSGLLLALLALGQATPAASQQRWRENRAARVEAPALDSVSPRLRRQGTIPASRALDSTHNIPLAGDGNHLVVRATFNGRLSGPMLIDTGASYCVLTLETAKRLRLRSGASIPVSTANGQVAADLVQLDSVQIEGARLTGVDALIMDAVEPPLIGIIGLNFLQHFRYSVDHARGTLQLER